MLCFYNNAGDVRCYNNAVQCTVHHATNTQRHALHPTHLLHIIHAKVLARPAQHSLLQQLLHALYVGLGFRGLGVRV